ncbi:MAG: hypothetical protein O2923_04930 [Verrucomicrobia bacterium]|nr:hypothetical protein [Verrucomicrobiota bacterium]MDA1086779.1 hypothetical protein [Verrucomicrobiota bacterium]
MVLYLILSSCISFGAIYPLLCWTHYGVPVMTSFQRFNFCVALFSISVALPCIVIIEGLSISAGLTFAWLVVLLGLTAAYWNRESIHEWIVSVPSIFGILLLFRLAPNLVPDGAPSPLAFWTMFVVGGLIPTSAVYATIFGHWFLETKGRVPVLYLTNCVWLLGVVLGLRAAWDIVALFTMEARIFGEPVPLWSYLAHLDGILLGAGILAGTILPLALVVMVHKTLKIRSTTSATGLLYSMVIAILIGDMSYRYYAIAHGLVL